MQHMAKTVNEIVDDVGEMRIDVGKIKIDVEEIKDDVGGIKDDVGEMKCLCSLTGVVSAVETQASPQGTSSNVTFENGFPRRARL